MAQLDLQDRALKSIHAVVVPDELVLVAIRLAVIAGRAGEFGDAVVVCSESASFSVGPKIFRWIEAESRGLAQRPSAPSAITRPVRLRGIFQHRELETTGDFVDRVHVRETAIEMDGK